MTSTAQRIVAGLGGVDNIGEIVGCTSRLRVDVWDPSWVDEAALRAAGAHGVIKTGAAVQVVLGSGAAPIATEIEGMM